MPRSGRCSTGANYPVLRPTRYANGKPKRSLLIKGKIGSTNIRTGVVKVSSHSEEGELKLGRLAPDEYFGESGLFSDTGEAGTIRASTFAVVYEVGRATLAKLMRDRPSIADEISVTLSRGAKVATSGTTIDHGVDDVPSISLLVRESASFLKGRRVRGCSDESDHDRRLA
ncbi:MAG: cyclic nucleotide-binding domain-containing protein [Reyranellales bacterium]